MQGAHDRPRPQAASQPAKKCSGQELAVPGPRHVDCLGSERLCQLPAARVVTDPDTMTKRGRPRTAVALWVLLMKRSPPGTQLGEQMVTSR
jgi:hypothetical protein